jgi:hypothetical protein
MKYPFSQAYIITQIFGENPGAYARFGMRAHNGIDFGAPLGTPVLAAADGEVITSEFDEGGYGKYIVIDHGDGYTSVYAHLSHLRVPARAQVKAGQLIGLTGSTGNSTGPHLHFEVRKRGEEQNGYWGAIDPSPLIEWPGAPEPAPAKAETPAGYKRINMPGVRLRNAPGLGGAILAELPKGTALMVGDEQVVGSGHTWQAVILYVAAEYLE